jgi:hypothetical protein
MSPLSQVAPPQQRWPEPPHTTQVTAAPPSVALPQTNPVSQVPLTPAQHICPPPPQTWQVPPTAPQFWQVRVALPGGLAQPSPGLQTARAQHASSRAPHA